MVLPAAAAAPVIGGKAATKAATAAAMAAAKAGTATASQAALASAAAAKSAMLATAGISAAGGLAGGLASALAQEDPKKQTHAIPGGSPSSVGSRQSGGQIFGNRADIGQNIPRSSLATQLLQSGGRYK